MPYKNHEGYPDPTSGRAINGVRWEELQQLREKEHHLKARAAGYVICKMSIGRSKQSWTCKEFRKSQKAILGSRIIQTLCAFEG